MKSLVIDLRGNPGGLLTSSVEVADKFVDEGVIVSTRGRSTAEDYNYTGHQAGTWRVPLVLLIDGDSASASEIFAGAIRDHRRGTLVGQRSYGKGSVQGIFPLSLAGAGMRLDHGQVLFPQRQADQQGRRQPRHHRPADGQAARRRRGRGDGPRWRRRRHVRRPASRASANCQAVTKSCRKKPRDPGLNGRSS